MADVQKITPFLWFDNQAIEAAKFYVSVFPDSKMITDIPYSSDAPSDKPVGSTMTVYFQILGMNFIALNGGPMFTFTEAISFVIACENQEEVDSYWEKLSADPKAEQCGWLKDKFGVSWQIIPTELTKLLTDKDPRRAERVMKAMLQMKKIVIADLQKAYDQE